MWSILRQVYEDRRSIFTSWIILLSQSLSLFSSSSPFTLLFCPESSFSPHSKWKVKVLYVNGTVLCKCFFVFWNGFTHPNIFSQLLLNVHNSLNHLLSDTLLIINIKDKPDVQVLPIYFTFHRFDIDLRWSSSIERLIFLTLSSSLEKWMSLTLSETKLRDIQNSFQDFYCELLLQSNRH